MTAGLLAYAYFVSFEDVDRQERDRCWIEGVPWWIPVGHHSWGVVNCSVCCHHSWGWSCDYQAAPWSCGACAWLAAIAVAYTWGRDAIQCHRLPLKNGDEVLRSRILYSTSDSGLYCFCYKLLRSRSDNSLFVSNTLVSGIQIHVVFTTKFQKSQRMLW